MAAAASYAAPALMFSSDRHSHGHGRHSHSHNSRSMIQRGPPQPSANGASLGSGGAQWNGPTQANGHSLANSLKPDTHTHSLAPFHPVKLDVTHHEHPDPNPLPHEPNKSAISSNGTPKSMERRRSNAGLPTHLRLGSSGYAFPLPSSPKYDSSNDGEARKWITKTEVISSVLVPLPYMLASLAFGVHGLHAQFPQSLAVGSLGKQLLETISNQSAKISTFDHGLLSTMFLASSTLLLVGFRGKVSGPPTKLDRRKSSTSKTDKGLGAGVRRVIERSIGVGLPFYATMKLGPDRVALIMLVALAADMTNVEDEKTDLISSKGWKRLLTHRRWTLISISLQIFGDFMGFSACCSRWDLVVGYLALLVSIFFVSPPFPSLKVKASPTSSSSATASPASTPKLLATQWEASPWPKTNADSYRATSPLVCTTEDINLTLAAGTALGVLTCVVFLISRPGAGSMSFLDLGLGFLSVCTAALSYQLVQPHAIRKNSGIGLLLGSVISWGLMTIFKAETWSYIVYQGICIGVTFAATKVDILQSLSISHTHHQTHHRSHHMDCNETNHHMPSRISRFMLDSFQKWPLLHSILAEKDSRRIFYFMCLNFAFMLVQTFYGVATGSLGLLSDSIHMFFDCLALVVGLCAAVMSKWPPSPRFPYGYGKMDTLAGFANGIFLMLISIEIVYEAIERLAAGSQMQRIGELLTVSSLGLAVNLVGMTAFGHAHHGHGHSHGHSHGGHSHADHSDHSHGDHHHEKANHAHHHHHGTGDHGHLHDHLHSHPTPSPLSSVPATPLYSGHVGSHSHGHDHHHHHHGNENMHGIFLHVLADTLGSVAVMVSTILIHFYGWSGFDPLASCLIAILIFASAIPLVTSSARTLLLTVPADTEFDLREALSGISGLRGVVGYAVPKFWLEEGEERKVLGIIHVIAAKGADLEDVKERAIAYLRGRHMEILVQVERDGSDRCWCRGGIKS